MTPPSRIQRTALFAIAFAVVVVVDQAAKALARSCLAGGPVTLVPGVMDLCLVFNEGAAFGLGEGFGWLFVAIAAAIVVACAAYVVAAAPGRALSCVLGAVAGGGVGNLIDRVVDGRVTDFFMPTFIDFAVFNVADIAITCGGVVAFVMLWRAADARPRRGGAAGEE